MKLTVNQHFDTDAHVIEADLAEGVTARRVVGNEVLRGRSIVEEIGRVVKVVEDYNRLQREEKERLEQERRSYETMREVYRIGRERFRGERMRGRVETWEFIGGSAHGRRYAVRLDDVCRGFKVAVADAQPAAWYPGAIPPTQPYREETYIPCVNVRTGRYAMCHEPYVRMIEGEEIQRDGSNAWRAL